MLKMSKPGSECVRVAVRCRPANQQEAGQRLAVSVEDAAGRMTLQCGVEPARTFTFDCAFGPGASQQQVYDATARELVDSALAGYNATLFAFGQTGTGKTHTMEGSGGEAAAGIIPRTFRQIFDAIGASQNQTFLVRVSMLEIYNEEIRDLLSKNPKNRLELHESRDGIVYVKGLNTFVVKSEAEIAAVLEVGKRNRSVGATLMNQDSSRSHSVFTITIEAAEASGAATAAAAAAGAAQAPGAGASGGCIRVGKLNLVDLAGSERQSKTGATGERLKEANKINLSLSALGNVISALVDGKSGHVPYRDSKLTRLLQDSLGGNTRTVMIANVGPAESNAEETLSTLRYANRAKNIQNKPRVNEDPKDAMLREFQEEIARLKAQLASGEGGLERQQADDGSSTCGSDGTVHLGVTSGGAAAEAAEVGEEMEQLTSEDVGHLREQMEAELRAEYSSSGVALDDAALAQIKQEVEVQLAAQLKDAQEEQRRARKEATRLEQQLQQQLAQVQKVAARKGQAQAHNAELAAKLRMLEGKLLHGEQKGGLDRLAKETAAQLSQQQQELKRRKAAEAKAARRIALLEANTQAVHTQYSSLQEEAEAVSQQLEEAQQQYEAARQELNDVYQQFEGDRQELVESIRSLHHSLALKNLVIDAFIPQEEVQKVLRRAVYNAAEGSWSLQSSRAGSAALPKRPHSAAPRSAASAHGRAGGGGGLLELQLDIPERNSLGYPDLQFALDAVMA